MLPVLMDMFPTLPEEVIKAALDAHGSDADSTIGALLDMCADAAVSTACYDWAHQSLESSPTSFLTPNLGVDKARNMVPAGPAFDAPAPPPCPQPKQAHHPQQRSSQQRRLGRAGAPNSPLSPPPPRQTWAQLRTAEQPAQPAQPHRSLNGNTSEAQPGPRWRTYVTPGLLPGPQLSPKYIGAPGAAGPAVPLGVADFPDLAPTAAAATAGAIASLDLAPFGGPGTHPALFAVRGDGNRRASASLLPASAEPGVPRGMRASASASSSSLGDLATDDPLSGPVGRTPGAGGRASQRGKSHPSSAKGAGGRAGQQCHTSPSLAPVVGRGNGLGYAQAAARKPAAVLPEQRGRSPGGWAHMAAGGGGAAGSGAGSGHASGDAGWEEEAVDELCRTHGWAGREIIQAVCMALKYDLSEVVSALDELRAASYQQEEQHPRRRATGSAGAAASSSDGPWASSASPSTSACPSVSCSSSSESEENECFKARRGGRANGVLNTLVDFPVHAAGRGPQRGDPGSGTRRRRGGRAREPGVDEGLGGPGAGGATCRLDGAAAGTARLPAAAGAAASTEEPSGDAYMRHRRDALKLTHSWRKRMSKASAAFSAGDRALGRALVAEAQRLRQQAVEAHRRAAERIEAEMNDGRRLSEWELDLHGLHADEAVAALARRITALELSAPAPATGNRARGPAMATAQPGPLATTTPAITTSASAVAAANTCLGATELLLASRRMLRVIVGKGLHSSGGEASLPRVVEAYLLQQGYKFSPRAGIVEVQLRRQYAVTSAPAR